MNIHYVGGEKEEGCGAAIWRNIGPKLKLKRGRVIDLTLETRTFVLKFILLILGIQKMIKIPPDGFLKG